MIYPESMTNLTWNEAVNFANKKLLIKASENSKTSYKINHELSRLGDPGHTFDDTRAGVNPYSIELSQKVNGAVNEFEKLMNVYVQNWITTLGIVRNKLLNQAITVKDENFEDVDLDQDRYKIMEISETKTMNATKLQIYYQNDLKMEPIITRLFKKINGNEYLMSKDNYDLLVELEYQLDAIQKKCFEKFFVYDESDNKYYFTIIVDDNNNVRLQLEGLFRRYYQLLELQKKLRNIIDNKTKAGQNPLPLVSFGNGRYKGGSVWYPVPQDFQMPMKFL